MTTQLPAIRACLTLVLLGGCAAAGDDGNASATSSGTELPTTASESSADGSSDSSGQNTASSDAGSSDADSSDADSSAAESTGSESTGATGVEVDGTLADFLGSTMGMAVAVEGAMVCVRDQPDVACAISEANGDYLLEGVTEGPVLLEIDHPDYPPFLLHRFADFDSPRFGLLMISAEALALLQGMVGSEPDPTRGTLALRVTDANADGQADVVASLAPMADALGPLYLDGAGIIDTMATATSSTGYFGWVDVPPGPHVYSVVHPTLECESALDPDTMGVDVVIEAGAITAAVNHRCG